MAEILAINNDNTSHHSPSRSPHKHVLRPRASFYRTTLPNFLPKQVKPSGGEPSLRSPVRLSDAARMDACSQAERSLASTSSTTRQSSRSRGGALLFPASPEDKRSPELHSTNTDSLPSTATHRDASASAGLRKFASSVSGAFANAKVRTSTRKATKPGFDLSDWNYDLAAIASHSSPSAASSTPGPTLRSIPLGGHPSLRILPPPPAGFLPHDNLITPTTVSFPPGSSLLRGIDHGVVLDVPAETRRRKSDEMEEEDRIDFHSPAPPVRRDNHPPRSLVHAHTLRSSRTLSNHASMLNESTTTTVPLASTTSSLFSPPASPFYTQPEKLILSPISANLRTRFSVLPNDSGARMINHSQPPSKKVSVMQDDSDESDDNVFGGSMGGKPKSFRARSFSRPSRAITAPIHIPSSSSHPGWTGNGFDILPNPRFKLDIAPRTRGKTRASSTNNLDTLSEMGPTLDYFSVPNDDDLAPDDQGSSTPSRRKDEGRFNLLGSKVASPRHSISTQHYDDFYSPGVPMSISESLSSRRATSYDSLYAISTLRTGPPSPPLLASRSSHVSSYGLRDSRSGLGACNHNGGRKRNANGALLVGAGSTHGSRLGAVSPILAESSSPAPWNARESRGEMDGEEEEDEDDAMEEDTRVDSWESNLSPPSLTDGTTSASSSLSTSLSSHADGENSIEARLHSSSQDSLKRRNNASNGTLFTPQNYKHVRPLQAAFMSTGLVSKRSRGRNDSGIGLGATPLYRPEPASANSVDAEATRPNDLAPPLNPLLASISRGSIMPDTPVKRAAFAHAPKSTRSNPSIDSIPRADPVIPCPSLHRSTSISPVGTIMNNAQSSTTNSPSPCGRSGEISPTSTRSLRSHATREVSAVSTSTTDRIAVNKRQLFRRRSSEQVIGDGNPPTTRVGRSGSSSSSSQSSGVILESDFEPMTPTRSVGAKWPGSSQLVATPGDSPKTPSTLSFSVSYDLPSPATCRNPPIATPQIRQSYPFSTFGTTNRANGRHQHQFRDRYSGLSSLPSRHEKPTSSHPSNWFQMNYSVLRVLGNGEFSDAFEVADRQRDGVYAVKRTKHAFGGPKDRLRRLEEVDILRLITSDQARSPHLIHLVDAWEQNGHLFIQTELCENGNLAYFLEEYGRLHEVLDETRVWKILNEIAMGVGYLHARDVIHLDLKPANVFITERGHLKLGDFGLATRWPRADAFAIVRGAAVAHGPGWERSPDDTIWNQGTGERRVRAKSKGDVPAQDLEREGDREYIAPEIMGGRYGKAADVFSVGLIILEAAANVVLPDNGPSWHKLRSNDFSDVDFSRLSHELIMLLGSMLEKSPTERASIDQVMAHPVVIRLADLLEASLKMDQASFSFESIDLEDARPLLGAILPEEESFLFNLFSDVYNYDHHDHRHAHPDPSTMGELDYDGDDSMEMI